MFVRMKHSRPKHVHVTVAKRVRKGDSVRHHHVVSLGEVRHSGQHADGRYKFAISVRGALWKWVENLLASEHFDAATAADIRDAVARKIKPPTPSEHRWLEARIAKATQPERHHVPPEHLFGLHNQAATRGTSPHQGSKRLGRGPPSRGGPGEPTVSPVKPEPPLTQRVENRRSPAGAPLLR